MTEVEGSSTAEKATDEVVWLDPQKPWFLIDDETPEGPFTLAELRVAMETGKVRGATYLWQEGLATWTRADSLERLGLLWEAAAAPEAPEAREGRRPTRDAARVTVVASRRPSEITETRVEGRTVADPAVAEPESAAAEVTPTVGSAPGPVAERRPLVTPLGWIAVGFALSSSIHFLAFLYWQAR